MYTTTSRCVKHRFIKFFVYDYDSLPYLLSLFFWLGVPFPLVAPDKISTYNRSGLEIPGKKRRGRFQKSFLSFSQLTPFKPARIII